MTLTVNSIGMQGAAKVLNEKGIHAVLCDSPEAKQAVADYGKGGLQLPALPQTDCVELAGKKAKDAKGIKGFAAKVGNAVKENYGKVKELVCKNNKNKAIAAAIAAVGVAAAAFGIYKGVQAHTNKVEAHQA